MSVSVFFALALAAGPAHALNPSRTYKQRPEKYNMEYAARTVTTADGAKLAVWDFPCTCGPDAPAVLVAHSGEGNMADYLRRVDALRQKHTVVIFDWRGFGESSEFEIDPNMYLYPHFQDDLAAMFDDVRKTHGPTYDVYGFGVGAGLALGMGWRRPEVKHIVADTPFLSMEDLEQRFSSWDTPMEVPFAGYDKGHEPVSALEQLPGERLRGVTLIVGSHDRLMKPADMEALAAKAKATARLKVPVHVIANPDQGDNFRLDKAAYTALVEQGLAN